MVDTDKLWEIADRYNTSKPVSGNWDTETEHELNAISKELGISKQEAKDLMIKELGFDDSMFNGINCSLDKVEPVTPPRSIPHELPPHNNEPVKQEKKTDEDGKSFKDYLDEARKNVNSSCRPVKSSKPGIGGGTVFETEVLMPKAEFDKWKRAVEREGVAYTVEYDFGGIGCYVTRNGLPKHIGTWFPDTEVLACDDVSLFGNYIDSSRRPIKSSKFFLYPCYIRDDRTDEGYLTLRGDLTDKIEVVPMFEDNDKGHREMDTWFRKLKWYDRYPDYEFRTEGMYIDEENFGNYNIQSSCKITSARYIATDPESGEVLGSADTYEEAVNEWGEDVTITDSEVAEGEENMGTGLFSNKKVIKSSNLPEEVYYMVVQGAKMYYSTDYDKVADMVHKMNNEPGPRVYGPYTETDPEEIAELVEIGYIKSSKTPNGDKAFLSNIVSSVSTNNMTEEQAIKRIALRNNCNEGFARNILSEALKDETLIQSGVMEIADDINKEFDIDGNIDSWLKAYMKDEGKSNTVGGEILRAFAKIRYRYYNDGDMIGRGYGKETVNPAARYLYEHVLDSSTADIEEMLNGESDINRSSETYEDWLEGYEGSLENYLRNNEELFHTPNKEDMLDYRTEEDKDSSVTECYIEDSYGNTYWFENDGSGDWKCYQIDFGTDAEFEVGDVVDSSQIEQYTDIDEDSDYVDFANDGLYYSAERYEGDEWEITNIELENGLANEGDYWSVDDLIREDVFDSNGNSLSENDLY